MIPVTAFSRLVERQESIPCECVGKEKAIGITLKSPGIILRRTEIKFIYFLRSVRSKQWKLKFSIAIFRPHQETQGVFGVRCISAEPSPNAYARSNLKSSMAVRVNQL